MPLPPTPVSLWKRLDRIEAKLDAIAATIQTLYNLGVSSPVPQSSREPLAEQGIDT